MNKARGDWDGGGRAKPALDYVIKYGHGLLRGESARWPRYLAVSTPTAFKTATPYLAQQPAGVAYPQTLDFGHLQQVSDTLPDDGELVVAIGGGKALDASKYVALAKGLPLVLAPTVVSSGAIIHGAFGRWEGRNLVGGLDQYPWVDSEDILVDYDVVLDAPGYLNTAGLGDVLSGYAGLAEWRRNSKLGIGPPWDDAVAAPGIEHHAEIVSGFPGTLSGDGELTSDSVHFIMTALHQRDSRAVRHPAAPGADHQFVVGVEMANDRSWVHGEMVALGAVIIAWQCDEEPETLLSWLDACLIRRRPSQMGLGRPELRKGLEFAPAFLADVASGRDVNTIMRHEPVVGARFEALWDFLEKG